MLVNRRLLLAGLFGAWPAFVSAQSAAPAPAPVSAPLPAVAAPVDTSALAYYASKHDAPRVEAELRRLRRLYPNWQPPADPMSLTVAPTGESDDKPLWDLFGADKLDELDAEIAKHKASDPAWNPPDELVAKLALKRTRMTLIAASDRKDYAGVIDIAAKDAALVTPTDLDVSWRVAEAYGRMGASDKALKIDQAILAGTQDPAERLATVRKAMATLAPTELDSLLKMGKPASDGQTEFGAVDLDLVRQRVGRVLGGSGTDVATPQDVARLEMAAGKPGGTADAALLGWVYSKRQDWAQANTWFQAALKVAPDPSKAKPEDGKVAQGAVLALKNTGHPSEAEALAYQWREADPALALLYIASVESDLSKPKPAPIEAERLKRFTTAVMAQQSGTGAQALGWYAYNVAQYKPALAWFQKAMAWQPRDTTALGLALSLKQLGDKDGLAAYLKENGPTFPALAALSTDQAKVKPARSGAPHAVRSRAGQIDGGAVPLDIAVAAETPLPRTTSRRQARGCTAASRYGTGQAALQAGWCLLQLDRAQEAAAAFAAARQNGVAPADAAYGQALASLRSNRTDEAIQAAESVDLTPKRRSEIGLAALAQTAATAFDEGRYKDTLKALDKRRMFEPEPRDLAVLRAWSTFHTGHREESQAMFSSLDAQLSTSETRAGVASTNQQSRY